MNCKDKNNMASNQQSRTSAQHLRFLNIKIKYVYINVKSDTVPIKHYIVSTKNPRVFKHSCFQNTRLLTQVSQTGECWPSYLQVNRPNKNPNKIRTKKIIQSEYLPRSLPCTGMVSYTCGCMQRTQQYQCSKYKLQRVVSRGS